MRHTDRSHRSQRVITLLATILLTFTVVGGVLAAISLPSSITVGDYTVDLVDRWYDADDTSTWVYAITADTDLGSATSHVSIGMRTCGVSEPADGDIYTTTTTMVTQSWGEVCGDNPYACVEGYYSVEAGAKDGTPPEPVVKFETLAGTEGLQAANTTHILVVKVEGANQTREDEGSTFVGLKNGTNFVSGELPGPFCEPTAVDIASLTGNSGAQMPLFLLGIVAAAGATGSTLLGERKRRD